MRLKASNALSSAPITKKKDTDETRDKKQIPAKKAITLSSQQVEFKPLFLNITPPEFIWFFENPNAKNPIKISIRQLKEKSPRLKKWISCPYINPQQPLKPRVKFQTDFDISDYAQYLQNNTYILPNYLALCDMQECGLGAIALQKIPDVVVIPYIGEIHFNDFDEFKILERANPGFAFAVDDDKKNILAGIDASKFGEFSSYFQYAPDKDILDKYYAFGPELKPEDVLTANFESLRYWVRNEIPCIRFKPNRTIEAYELLTIDYGLSYIKIAKEKNINIYLFHKKSKTAIKSGYALILADKIEVTYNLADQILSHVFSRKELIKQIKTGIVRLPTDDGKLYGESSETFLTVFSNDPSAYYIEIQTPLCFENNPKNITLEQKSDFTSKKSTAPPPYLTALENAAFNTFLDGTQFFHTEQNTKAIQYLVKTTQLYKQILDKHLQTSPSAWKLVEISLKLSITNFQLGLIYHKIGEYEQALKVLNESYFISFSFLKGKHPLVHMVKEKIDAVKLELNSEKILAETLAEFDNPDTTLSPASG